MESLWFAQRSRRGEGVEEGGRGSGGGDDGEGGGGVVSLTCFSSEVINPVCSTPRTQTQILTSHSEKEARFL